MNLVNLSRAARARLGVLAGGLSVAFGSAMQWGTGVGLLVGGAMASTFFLLVYEVDEERRR